MIIFIVKIINCGKVSFIKKKKSINYIILYNFFFRLKLGDHVLVTIILKSHQRLYFVIGTSIKIGRYIFVYTFLGQHVAV